MTANDLEAINAAAEEPSGADLAQTGRDLFAGAMGGIAQVLIGQPFDIVKVRLQTSSAYSGALDCASKIYANEGALAFYKGTLTPLVGIGACVSVQFGGFHAARRHFEAQNTASSASGAPHMSFAQTYAAGAFAGLANTLLASPIEHVRIRLQTQPTPAAGQAKLYRSPVECIRTLCSGEAGGVARGLYRGAGVTALREVQAYGSWFLTYEFLMGWDVRRRELEGRHQVEAWRLGAYGGLAGEVLWLASYPFDVVKSRMQTDGLLQPGRMTGEGGGAKEAMTTEEIRRGQMGVQRYVSARDCFAQTFKEGGVGAFWRGIGPTLLRAMPVSAATFVVAEQTLRLISPS